MYGHPFPRFALHAALVVAAVAAVWYALMRPEAFSEVFAREDGIVEYATAILLAVAGVILVGLARRVTGYRRWLLTVYALAFFVAAGEEISWGQRIFGIESTEFFLENNRQGEINFHNLVVDGEQLVSFFFGQLLTVVILLYLVVLPLLWPVAGRVRWIADALAVPVPPRYIGALAILWSVLVVWIDLPRNWEVYEFAFSAMICLVFLAPVNRETFRL
jgi:hypothetical protein